MNSANVFLFAIAFYAGVTPHLNTKAGLAEKAYLILIVLFAASVTCGYNISVSGYDDVASAQIYMWWAISIAAGVVLGYGLWWLLNASVATAASHIQPEKEKRPGVV